MNKVDLFGVPISCVTRFSIIPEIESLLKSKKQLFISTPNPEHVMLAQTDLDFKKALQKADLASPDGIGVVWAVKRKLKTKNFALSKTEESKHEVIERVTGIDLMLELCRMADQKKMRIGLLGGAKGIAQKAAVNLRSQYKNLEVIVLPEYIYNKKDTEIVQSINQSGPVVLFVALGAPKQELFISKYLQNMSNVRLAMGVGGAFDVISGNLKRPPLWVQNMGLEWIFRLIQEPWRLKRQSSLVVFIWKVFTTTEA